MPSARYRCLTSNIKKLEKRFLPGHLTGPFSDREHDLARGFRLLAHAEIEAYLEDRAREISLCAVRKFLTDRKPHLVVFSLISFQKSELSEKYLKQYHADQLNHLDSVVKCANNSYQRMLANNHGIREDNILSILLPIGFTAAQIDSTWLCDMNSFGRERGETAHSAITATKLVDPKNEKTTVTQLITGLAQIDAVFSRLKP